MDTNLILRAVFSMMEMTLLSYIMFYFTLEKRKLVESLLIITFMNATMFFLLPKMGGLVFFPALISISIVNSNLTTKDCLKYGVVMIFISCLSNITIASISLKFGVDFDMFSVNTAILILVLECFLFILFKRRVFKNVCTLASRKKEKEDSSRNEKRY